MMIVLSTVDKADFESSLALPLSNFKGSSYNPTSDLTSATTFLSDTATLPYPTNASITTPQSSLARGDWGLKRALPQRSTTRTSTPVIRVSEVDSREHITEFQSASDHTLTLWKWQEMHLPISMKTDHKPTAVRLGSGNKPFQSVFENAVDATHVGGKGEREVKQRWKFDGPWLAGKTEGEFRQYVQKQIRQRKQEFREFVREELIAQNAAEKRRLARESGQLSESGGGKSAQTDNNVSDEELNAYIKSLRRDRTGISSLIHAFLDLPASPTQLESFLSLSSWQPSGFRSIYAETGPPKTHPSAGLSYLRTASIIPNHPVLGPQAFLSPVEARILMPRKSALGTNNLAVLGVGGIAAQDDVQPAFKTKHEPPGMQGMDPNLVGGGKVWVHPVRAEVDARGRIKLETKRPWKSEVVDIHKGQLQEKPLPISTARPVPERSEADITAALLGSDAFSPYGSKSNYGIEDSRSSR
ncbi:MAG: hypothetical protein M1833_004055 [Piccolia ochrophora]|nr:MAG: hypothetical protein M1833_004055 [Piccolia ochrophora]